MAVAKIPSDSHNFIEDLKIGGQPIESLEGPTALFYDPEKDTFHPVSGEVALSSGHLIDRDARAR